MEKISLLVLSVVVVLGFSFSACAAVNNQTTKVATNTKKVATKKETKKEETPEKVDIDLTKLKGNMLYSELTNIVDNYEDYVGKRIRYIGKMGIMEGDKKCYFTVSAGDVSACCNQQIEFVLKGGSEDKKDYPAEGKRVRISGVLEPYTEGKQTYIHLVDSELYVYKN